MVKHDAPFLCDDVCTAGVVNKDDKRGGIEGLITQFKRYANTIKVGVDQL